MLATTRWCALLPFAILVGCPSSSTKPKPDPIASASTKPDVGPPPSPRAIVTTNRIELVRKGGHPPVVLELPIVKGIAAADLVNQQLSTENILGQTLDEVKADAKAANAIDVPFGVQSAKYSVLYNAYEILEIEASIDTMGAYPSTQRFHALIDLRTGAPIAAAAFLSSQVPSLVKRLETMREAETKAAAAKEPAIVTLAKGVHFAEKDLADLSLKPEGVTFNFDYGFPHVARAIQPPGRYFLPWSALADDIDRNGPLARAMPHS